MLGAIELCGSSVVQGVLIQARERQSERAVIAAHNSSSGTTCKLMRHSCWSCSSRPEALLVPWSFQLQVSLSSNDNIPLKYTREITMQQCSNAARAVLTEFRWQHQWFSSSYACSRAVRETTSRQRSGNALQTGAHPCCSGVCSNHTAQQLQCSSPQPHTDAYVVSCVLPVIRAHYWL
jgi:hypothetical protein